jgi:hypothetical protein
MNNSVRVIVAVSALVVLGGCVAVPAQPGYYEPAPVVYVPAPVYYGPTIRFGYSRGWGGHGYHGGGRGRGYR